MKPAKVLPQTDQFPTFKCVVETLEAKGLQCIWYLPDKRRLCLVKNVPEQMETALQLAKKASESYFSEASLLEDLAAIAVNCCCPRHHRNQMMYQSGLKEKLADRWYGEIQKEFSVKPPQTGFYIKSEGSTTDAEVTFARRHVLEGQTLVSALLLDIDEGASKNGSLYFYTHLQTAFSGMIKIGYGRSVQTRLNAWTECGHGLPKLLKSFADVRHPERVESLVHFELLDCWYEQRWCKVHQHSHIEWFKIDVERADAVASFWCRWMSDANPYDRRGKLQSSWQSHIDFLLQHDNPVTAKAMMLIHEIETGSPMIHDFIDDDKLRQVQKTVVKKEVKEEE